MTLYRVSQDTAFESAVGALGADKTRFQHWLDALAPLIPAVKDSPQREAAPVLSLPATTEDLAEIESVAKQIREQFSTLVVVGMGGSSLSGEALTYLRKSGGTQLRFVDNIDPATLSRLCEQLNWKETAFLVISKSGGTVETLAQFAVLLRHAKQKIGAGFAKHFTIITITNGNVLHSLAKAHDIRVIAHDPDLGGRFSILSSVGLVPAAVMGLDIRALRAGAQQVITQHFSGDMAQAPAAQGAALQLALIEKQTRQHVFLHYVDALSGLALWFRQCWGESLGKCDKATSPVTARGTTDQHSQLQLYLDGPRDKLFSMLMLEYSGQGDPIDFPDSADPRLAFLKGRTLGDLMVAEQRATFDSLVQRGCPTRSFSLTRFDEQVMGALLMHFALEIMFTAKLLKIDAFDQPAVEDGKKIALAYLAGEDGAGAQARRA
ncbi:MAG: glucose-6-phosphate isomerase [Proteobacteria bacterium]|nr:glucose-6-phosphate isomerase [Pseudomonadota bacterium]